MRSYRSSQARVLRKEEQNTRSFIEAKAAAVLIWAREARQLPAYSLEEESPTKGISGNIMDMGWGCSRKAELTGVTGQARLDAVVTR